MELKKLKENLCGTIGAPYIKINETTASRGTTKEGDIIFFSSLMFIKKSLTWLLDYTGNASP